MASWLVIATGGDVHAFVQDADDLDGAVRLLAVGDEVATSVALQAETLAICDPSERSINMVSGGSRPKFVICNSVPS